MESNLWTTRQAAARMAVCDGFVEKRSSPKWTGVRIPSIKVGSRRRYRPEDIENYIKFCQVAGDEKIVAIDQPKIA